MANGSNGSSILVQPSPNGHNGDCGRRPVTKRPKRRAEAAQPSPNGDNGSMGQGGPLPNGGNGGVATPAAPLPNGANGGARASQPSANGENGCVRHADWLAWHAPGPRRSTVTKRC
jgi:hypothetical protein